MSTVLTTAPASPPQTLAPTHPIDTTPPGRKQQRARAAKRKQHTSEPPMQKRKKMLFPLIKTKVKKPPPVIVDTRDVTSPSREVLQHNPDLLRIIIGFMRDATTRDIARLARVCKLWDVAMYTDKNMFVRAMRSVRLPMLGHEFAVTYGLTPGELQQLTHVIRRRQIDSRPYSLFGYEAHRQVTGIKEPYEFLQYFHASYRQKEELWDLQKRRLPLAYWRRRPMLAVIEGRLDMGTAALRMGLPRRW